METDYAPIQPAFSRATAGQCPFLEAVNRVFNTGAFFVGDSSASAWSLGRSAPTLFDYLEAVAVLVAEGEHGWHALPAQDVADVDAAAS
jgi:hypothetical protein